MNREEATQLLDSIIADYEVLGFDGVLLQPSHDARQIAGPTGCEYQIEVDVVKHPHNPRVVDVIVSIDDGGIISAWSPLTKTLTLCADSLDE